MGRKAARRRQNPYVTRQTGGVAAIERPAARGLPDPPPQRSPSSAALVLRKSREALVTSSPDGILFEPERLAPLPRSRALVDPRLPVMRKLRGWLVGIAERWAERNRPLPEAPTLAELERLRKDLASVQRRLERLVR